MLTLDLSTISPSTGRTTCRPWHVHRSETLFETESQPELFEADGVPPAYRPDPDEVRAQLHKILAEARPAEKLPWDPDKVLLYRTIFPHMAAGCPSRKPPSCDLSSTPRWRG